LQWVCQFEPLLFSVFSDVGTTYVILPVPSTAGHSPCTGANSHIMCGISSLISVSAMTPAN